MKSKTYWIDRQTQIEKKVFRKSKKLEQELKEEYLKAEQEISKSVSDIFLKYAKDNKLTYLEATKNLTSQELKGFRMTVKQYKKEIERLRGINPEKADELLLELKTLSAKSRITRLESLTTQIDHQLNTVAFSAERELGTLVTETYADTFKLVTTDLGLTGVNTILPVKDIERLMRIPWSGENFSARIWENTEKVARITRQEIIQGFIQGVNPQKLTKSLSEKLGANYSNAERLARTELNYALNQSTLEAYKEAKVEEYEYLAHVDEKTSDVCIGLNGKKKKVKEAVVGVNYPPMHPRCRSTVVPVID